jgi:hypothetical protein
MIKKPRFPASRSTYNKHFKYGYDFDWSFRIGGAYDQNWKEVSIYIGPFRFWMGK